MCYNSVMPGGLLICYKLDDFIFHATSRSSLKGRFLMLLMYHNFANLFSTLSESTFYKEISKF